MSPEFENWLRLSLDFLAARRSEERALEVVGSVIRQNPELSAEFMLDKRVQPPVELETRVLPN